MKNKKFGNRSTEYNINDIEKSTIYFRVFCVLLAAVDINFLSGYYKNIPLLNTVLGIYLIYSLVLRYYINHPFSTVLFNATLFFDTIIISIMVAIRGGIRSDLYLAYILVLTYSVGKKQKSLVASLCAMAVTCYFIACQVCLNNDGFSYGRFIIRMSIILLIAFILYYVNKDMRHTEDEREKAFQMALIDPLTTVFSRNMLGYIKSHHPSNQSGFCMALMDIDDLKTLNDTMGHQAGDNVLKLLGESIRENIGEDNLCIRYGGDEFLLLYMNNANVKKAEDNINKIRTAFHNNINASIHEISCTFSAGISVCPPEANLEKGIYKADIALYNAKKENKNRTVIYDEKSN